MTAADFALKLEAKPTGEGKWEARCPAHEDNRASLSIGTGEGGRVLLKCHADCANEAVVAALGLSMRDLMPEREKGKGGAGRLVQTYDYTDESGALLFQVCRYEPKTFKQRRPNGKAGWIWKQGERLVLYRLRALLAAIAAGAIIWLCDGEKDADALAALGLAATCNPMGAGKWRQEYTRSLVEAPEVVIIADKDEPGRKHAQAVAASLHATGVPCRVIEVPTGKDSSDWIAAGATRGDFGKLAAAAPAWGPRRATTTEEPTDTRPDESQPVWAETDRPWPAPLTEAAFQGLAGDIVRTLAPHTESDTAAILLQVLCAFGSAIGRRAFYQVEGARHHGNLYIVLVGATAKGRKGTSWGRVRELFASETIWLRDCQVSGLSSGEGLIWRVRNAEKPETAAPTKGRKRKPDPGVSDKRLLVVESEYARVLRIVEREGCTISPVLREAWDTGNLAILTKNSPATATDAHIATVGHITATELRRYLDATEVANGFGNRNLWIAVQRSKVLPFGGNPRHADLQSLQHRLATAIEKARLTGRVRLSPEARRLWAAVYPKLSDGRPGLLGALTARAEAQAVRLALLYALLDEKNTIEEPHLRAALAIVEYVERTVSYVFGDAIGDREADAILAALRRSPEGLTRTAINELFGGHRGRGVLDRALAELLRMGLATCAQESTKGRTAERWIAKRPTSTDGAYSAYSAAPLASENLASGVGNEEEEPDISQSFGPTNGTEKHPQPPPGQQRDGGVDAPGAQVTPSRGDAEYAEEGGSDKGTVETPICAVCGTIGGTEGQPPDCGCAIEEGAL